MPIEPAAISSALARLLGQPRDWANVRRKRFWLLAALATYSLGGYLLAPWILQREITSILQQQLARPVTLEKVRIDPFALSVDLRGFRITETDGAPLAGFDRLYVRVSVRSLIYRAWTVDTIKLIGLSGNLIRFGGSDTNIGRVLQPLTAGPAPDAKPEANTGLPRLVIRHLSLQNAQARLTDHLPGKLFQTDVGPVNLDFTNVSTLPQKTGEQHIEIGLEGGASLDWVSQSGINPPMSSGHVTVKGPYVPLLSRYFGDMLKLAAPSGSLDVGLDYQLQQRPDGQLGLTLDHAELALTGLTLQEPGAATPFLSLPSLRLSGGHLDWPEQKAGAEHLILSDLSLNMRRQANGQIAPAPWASSVPAPAPAKAAPAPSGPDWSVTLGKAELRNAKAEIEDRTPHQPTKLEVHAVDLTLDGISSKPGTAMPFALSAALAGGGITAQGHVTALPDLLLDAKIAINALHLSVIQAYLHDFARLSIDGGQFDGQSDLKLDGAGLTATGSGAVQGLKLTDEVEKTPVVAWDRLGVDRFDFSQSANELQISQVNFVGPFLRFRLAKDQSTNFSHILISAPAATKAAPPAPAPSGPPMKISVGKIAISKGGADYGDSSLPLPFTAHITDLQGTVATLSSASSSPTRVSLRGQVDQYGQARIEGSLTPFDPAKNTKMAVSFHNVEFPGLTPYVLKFAGRRVAKGRLDVDLNYAIANSKMNGANRVVIRDFELGEKVDVPGAMDLPLDLAIALLKDDDGKIDIDLPVTGDLNDPQFDIGSVITQTVFKLLGNLITSPFRALAGLFGGDGPQLDHIAFAPGRADLAPPEKEKILHLADALKKRPSLGLVVPTVLDPEDDKAQLQFDALDARMDKELGKRNTVTRQRQYLESQFEETVGKDQLAPLKQSFMQNQTLDEPAYVAALREKVAKAAPVPDASLTALAQARAAAVAGSLGQVPGIDPKRIRQQGNSTAKLDESGAIPLTLEAESVR